LNLRWLELETQANLCKETCVAGVMGEEWGQAYKGKRIATSFVLATILWGSERGDICREAFGDQSLHCL